FDADDPLRHGVSPPSDLPGEAFTSFGDLVRSPDARQAWTRRDEGVERARYEIWSDRPRPTQERTEDGSEGSRLWVRRDDLRGFLTERQMDLICEVHIDRHITSRYSSQGDERQHKAFHRILVLRRGGTIE